MPFEEPKNLDRLHLMMRRHFFMAGRMNARLRWDWDVDRFDEAFNEMINTNWESMADFYNAGAVDPTLLLFWFGMGWTFEKDEISSGRVTGPEDNWRLTEIEAAEFNVPPGSINPHLN